MGWALVFLICSRSCNVQYVELYPTREACVAKQPKDTNWSIQTACVPIAKDIPQTK